MSKPAATLCLPAADAGWETWHTRGTRAERAGTPPSPTPSPGPHPAPNLIVGVPSTECTTLGLKLPAADPALFQDMVFAQLEKRGLVRGEPEDASFAWHLVEQSERETILSVDVLGPEFPQDLILPQATRYTAAERLYPLPDQAAVILRQHGRLILLTGKHGRLLFSQILSADSAFDANLAREIDLDLLTLRGVWNLPEHLRLHVWTPVLPEDRDTFSRQLSIPVQFEDLPAPDPAALHDSDPMLPPEVRTAHRDRTRRRKFRLAILAVAAFYVLAAVLLALYNQDQQRRARDLRARIEAARPEVQFIQNALTRARTLEPAFEKRFYPMRQLNEIARTMPPSGLVILKFTTRERDIRLEGLARDPQLAYQLIEDLQVNDELAGYAWEMPPPSMNQNNTAAFRIDGSYANAQP